MLNFLNSFNISANKTKVLSNLPVSELVERSILQKKGILSEEGSLVVKTGLFTGRAAKDKYVVLTTNTAKTINWEGDVNIIYPDHFSKLKLTVLNYLRDRNELYVMDQSAGSMDSFNIGLRLITPSPVHALFAKHMFKKKIDIKENEIYTILHAPELTINPTAYQTRSSTVIAINFDKKEIIIIGTAYAGEIKKAIFSVLSYILPEKGILPMHAGANIDLKGNVSVFFGLSGTGKTTLSTDTNTSFIGDDEHGLSQDGIFNFEGGCYAKTIDLSQKNEPEIYSACTRFGALLENVSINNDTKELDFSNDKLTVNTRGSYPLTFIQNTIKDNIAPIPKNIFFLSADAFGVLPPVAKLNHEQAMYYFISGYTAKLAGTEVGVKGPSATFSCCFGAPFMLRKPHEYSSLLGKYIRDYSIDVWLINSGWSGGPYKIGERFAINTTRSIIRAIQSGKLHNEKFKQCDHFNLSIPEKIEGVPSNILNPKEAWKDKLHYAKTATSLTSMFKNNYEKYEEHHM